MGFSSGESRGGGGGGCLLEMLRSFSEKNPQDGELLPNIPYMVIIICRSKIDKLKCMATISLLLHL